MTTQYCLDIGCEVTFEDCAWLLENALTEKILKIATPLKVKRIGTSKHDIDEFIFMFLYFPGINSRNRPVYAHINQTLQLVKGLKANLLVSINILAKKRVIINFAIKTAVISRNQVTISVTTRLRGKPI